MIFCNDLLQWFCPKTGRGMGGGGARAVGGFSENSSIFEGRGVLRIIRSIRMCWWTVVAQELLEIYYVVRPTQLKSIFISCSLDDNLTRDPWALVCVHLCQQRVWRFSQDFLSFVFDLIRIIQHIVVYCYGHRIVDIYSYIDLDNAAFGTKVTDIYLRKCFLLSVYVAYICDKAGWPLIYWDTGSWL